MSALNLTHHRVLALPDGTVYGECARHKALGIGSYLTFMRLNDEWFCDFCLVNAINSGEFSLIEGLPIGQEAPPLDFEVEWT